MFNSFSVLWCRRLVILRGTVVDGVAVVHGAVVVDVVEVVVIMAEVVVVVIMAEVVVVVMAMAEEEEGGVACLAVVIR
jgi:hypothetical protein